MAAPCSSFQWLLNKLRMSMSLPQVTSATKDHQFPTWIYILGFSEKFMFPSSRKQYKPGLTIHLPELAPPGVPTGWVSLPDIVSVRSHPASPRC